MLLALSVCTVVPAQPPATPVNVYDGFETPALSDIWLTSRFAPGAVSMQSTYVRRGHSALKITVHPGDEFEAGNHGDADSERAELLEARSLVARDGDAVETAFSIFLPADFPIVPTRLVVAQWKQYCPPDGSCFDDSPGLAVRYIGGVLSITQDLERKFIVLYKRKIDLRHRWVDLRFQTRFAADQNGRIKAWINSREVVDFRGITANEENAATHYPSPSHFYFKFGLYRNVMSQPMTIYIDEYRKRLLRADQL